MEAAGLKTMDKWG